MRRYLAMAATMGIAWCMFAGTARADSDCQQGLSTDFIHQFTTIAIDQANDRYAFIYWGKLTCPVESFATLEESYPDKASFEAAVESNMKSNWLGIADTYKENYENLKDAILVKEILAKKNGQVTLYAIPKEACQLASDGLTFWCQHDAFGAPNQWSDLEGKSREEKIKIVSERLEGLFEKFGGNESIASQYRMAGLLRSSSGGMGFDDMKQSVDEGTSLPDEDLDGIIDEFDDELQDANLGSAAQGEDDDQDDQDNQDGQMTLEEITEAMAEFARKDFDSDGVVNIRDKCPETPARTVVDEQGCAVKQASDDSDADGVADVDDACPDIAGGEGSVDGCPLSLDVDADGDGVPDVDDLCPAEAAGNGGAQGCPQFDDGASCTLNHAAGNAGPMGFLLLLLPLLPLGRKRCR